MQNQNMEQENIKAYFENLTVTFNSYVGVKKTDKSRFYKVYSPIKFKLRPRDDIQLDLKFNIETSNRVSPWLN